MVGIIIVCSISFSIPNTVLVGVLELPSNSMFQIIANHLHSSRESSSVLAFLIYYLLSTLFHSMLVIEISKVLQWAGASILYHTKVHNYYIKRIYRLSLTSCTYNDIIKSLQFFKRLSTIHSVGLTAGSWIVACFLGFGFYVGITSSCFLILGWRFLSPFFLFIIVVLNLENFILLLLGLSLAPESLEVNQKIILVWKSRISELSGNTWGEFLYL